MYASELILHLLGAVLSTIAAGLALWMLPQMGKVRAWWFICAALVLVAADRIGELLAHIGLFAPIAHEIFVDILLLVVSALALVGVIYFRITWLERKATQHLLEQQLDELQRFRSVTISRELRMKDLHDENQALKARLQEVQNEHP